MSSMENETDQKRSTIIAISKTIVKQALRPIRWRSRVIYRLYGIDNASIQDLPPVDRTPFLTRSILVLFGASMISGDGIGSQISFTPHRAMICFQIFSVLIMTIDMALYGNFMMS